MTREDDGVVARGYGRQLAGELVRVFAALLCAMSDSVPGGSVTPFAPDQHERQSSLRPERDVHGLANDGHVAHSAARPA